MAKITESDWAVLKKCAEPRGWGGENTPEQIGRTRKRSKYDQELLQVPSFRDQEAQHLVATSLVLTVGLEKTSDWDDNDPEDSAEAAKSPLEGGGGGATGSPGRRRRAWVWWRSLDELEEAWLNDDGAIDERQTSVRQAECRRRSH